MAASELKDKIRSETIGSNKVFRFKRVTINDEGTEIEIREPTVKEWGNILRNVMTVDGDKGQTKMEYDQYLVWSVICCAFVPDTDEKVFSEEDYETLLAMPKSSWVGEFSDIALAMMQSNVEETEKNLKKTVIDSQSSQLQKS